MVLEMFYLVYNAIPSVAAKPLASKKLDRKGEYLPSIIYNNVDFTISKFCRLLHESFQVFGI